MGGQEAGDDVIWGIGTFCFLLLFHFSFEFIPLIAIIGQ